VVFRHERSRLLADHIGHPVSVVLTKTRRPDTKGACAWCERCKLMIGAVPKALRQRKTWCCIQMAEQNAAALLPESAKPVWLDLLSGTGRPNEDAGDRFNRKEGRENAFVNALTGPEALAVFASMQLSEADIAEFTKAAAEAYAESAVTVIDGHFAEVLRGGSNA
jgi:hypothetical protein